MKIVRNQTFTGERALFQANDLQIVNSVFEDGESPLKHSKDLILTDCAFRWKYPLWYSRDIRLRNVSFLDTARAGIWYTEQLQAESCEIAAPKAFRRCADLRFSGVSFPNAAETLWNCRNVELRDVSVTGDYFGMNCRDVAADGLEINGNYCFDGAKNLEIRNARLISKDAFWNCENVTVSDSFISGEYFGWNSNHMTLINCTVESLQGFCFIQNLTLKNCTLPNTTLAFEYSTVDAEISGSIDSVKNPLSGVIRARSIGELILDPSQIDPQNVRVICEE